MPDPTIHQLESERYTHIECECRCGKTMTPFKMLRAEGRRIDELTIADLGQRMICKGCGERPSRYRAWRQEDAFGFQKEYSHPKEPERH